MTMTTLDDHIKKEEDLLGDTRKIFKTLRDEIDELCERLADGQVPDDVSANCPKITKLRTLYSVCTETENRLAKCTEVKAGIAQNGIAFDLDAARDSIGSKLDRLRAAADAERISG